MQVLLFESVEQQGIKFIEKKIIILNTFLLVELILLLALKLTPGILLMLNLIFVELQSKMLPFYQYLIALVQ